MEFEHLIKKIEACEFECLAGRLEKCLEWIQLKELLLNKK